ncbi:MAG: VWA domain-containing protein [Luteitalea sp.]|nr:VWA domain-containing protein [Luteitalea sp.]
MILAPSTPESAANDTPAPTRRRRGRWVSVVTGLATLAALTVPMAGVQGLASGQYTSGVELVEVYATVTGRDGRPVSDLARDEFEVREEGVAQPIAAFATGALSLSVALAVDRSFSMRGDPLRLAKSAAHRFIGELQPEDRVMLVAIGGEVETIVPLTTDRIVLHRAIEALDSWGTTPIYDAVIAAFDSIEHAPGRRALVVLSDGYERFSKATAEAALGRARRSDVLAYPIALGTERSQVLDWLAEVTGGRSFLVKRPDRLAPTFGQIARELRHQYLLGYVPRPRGQHGYRRIEVSVKRKDLSVRARAGYYAR